LREHADDLALLEQPARARAIASRSPRPRSIGNVPKPSMSGRSAEFRHSSALAM
jgi:hypothetical protein